MSDCLGGLVGAEGLQALAQHPHEERVQHEHPPVGRQAHSLRLLRLGGASRRAILDVHAKHRRHPFGALLHLGVAVHVVAWESLGVGQPIW